MNNKKYAKGYVPNVCRPRVVRSKVTTCAYCGMEGLVGVDHVTPLALGGANDSSNWNRACRSCNLSKGKLSLERWRQTLARRSMGAPYFSPRHIKFALECGLDLTAIFENKAKEIKFAYEGGNPAVIKDLVSKTYLAGC